ncbi:MAG: HD domain-containing protein [Desulfuromonadales bacterium]|nr:MAG: HD domain-containing protein [Desulfuromonadales bacterium]
MNLGVIEPLRNAVRHLVTAVASAALYARDHQQVTRLQAAALRDLTAALEAQPELSLVVIDEELMVDGAILDTGLYMGRFVTMLSSRGIGHVKFLEGVTEQELAYLTTTLSGGIVGSELRSTEHIRLGRVEVRFSAREGNGTGRNPLADFSAEEIARFTELYDGVVRTRKVHVAGIADMVGGFIVALREQARPLMALAPLRDMDEYTFTHSVNVCILNLAQAMSLGIDGPPLQEIGIAGLLHDIGKMFVPPEILTKPAKLDKGEWEIMRRHPLMGARCLIESPGVPRLAAVVAYEHHMKHDLSGYPAVRAGWRQSLCSEITAISDFFDALRTRRAYCDSLELRQIAGMLLDQRGREFHPLLTRNFLLILSRMMS